MKIAICYKFFQNFSNFLKIFLISPKKAVLRVFFSQFDFFFNVFTYIDDEKRDLLQVFPKYFKFFEKIFQNRKNPRAAVKNDRRAGQNTHKMRKFMIFSSESPRQPQQAPAHPPRTRRQSTEYSRRPTVVQRYPIPIATRSVRSALPYLWKHLSP